MTRYFIAGNYWLTFALLLFLGRKIERSNPTRYSFFGGGWLDPTTYLLLILLPLGMAAMCFGLMWMTRTRGGGLLPGGCGVRGVIRWSLIPGFAHRFFLAVVSMDESPLKFLDESNASSGPDQNETSRDPSDLIIDDDDRYGRLRLIPWWRQERITAARILVVGAGALGNEVLKNLALLGVGSIYVIDLDRVEASNLSRSVLFRAEDGGQSKAKVAARRAKEINPEIKSSPFMGT